MNTKYEVIDDYYVFGSDVPNNVYNAILQEFYNNEHFEIRELVESSYKETSDSRPYILVEHRLIMSDDVCREACEKEFLLDFIGHLINVE